MADQFIQLPDDSAETGKKLDTERLTVGAETVDRERHQIAGAADDDISVVVDTDPGATDHGLVTRPAPPVAPRQDTAVSTALASGASDDLDGTTISAATTGKLGAVVVSSTMACKWVIKTRDAAVEVELATLYTSGLQGAKPTEVWKPPHKDYATLAGAGVDENFRVTVTNLGTFAADASAAFSWDEV